MTEPQMTPAQQAERIMTLAHSAIQKVDHLGPAGPLNVSLSEIDALVTVVKIQGAELNALKEQLKELTQ